MCPECWGTGQRLIARDVHADIAADVRLVAQELCDFRGAGRLADILTAAADRLDNLTTPDRAA
jgi:hypothetical protein